MKLTPAIAHQIALDHAPQIKPQRQGEFFVVHTTNVVKIAKIIAKKLNLDEDFFEIAGRIHDIGYAKDFEHHGEASLSILTDL
jgi:HD superfamily phosphodiesterase